MGARPSYPAIEPKQICSCANGDTSKQAVSFQMFVEEPFLSFDMAKDFINVGCYPGHVAGKPSSQHLRSHVQLVAGLLAAFEHVA